MGDYYSKKSGEEGDFHYPAVSVRETRRLLLKILAERKDATLVNTETDEEIGIEKLSGGDAMIDGYFVGIDPEGPGRIVHALKIFSAEPPYIKLKDGKEVAIFYIYDIAKG